MTTNHLLTPDFEKSRAGGAGTTPHIFILNWSPYVVGDIAGFTPDVASKLIASGHVRTLTPAELATALTPKPDATYTGGGGPESDPVAVALIKTIKKDPASPAVSGDDAWGTSNLWTANKTTTVPSPATDASFAASPDWDPIESTQIDEVVLSAADLTGAAPAGAKSGVNVATGTEFVVVAGNWVLRPGAAPTPTHYPDVIRASATRGVAPTAGETSVTLVDGDMVSIFLSDKTEERWTRAAGTWPTPHTIDPPSSAIVEVAPDGTPLSTTGVIRIVRDPALPDGSGNFLEVVDSNGKVVSA